MTTDSSKARLELILTLSLPRDPGSTTCLESGSMKNLSRVANRTRQRAIDKKAPIAELKTTNHKSGSSLSLPPESDS